jgi:phospholipid/cholesterol/gamma-HCH transport system substrate-binding protein
VEREQTPKLPQNFQFRAGLLIGLTLVVAIGFVAYVLYARGFFEAKQPLTLVTDNAEGVSIGDDLSFAGFPVGRVRRIALGEDGRARIELDIPLDGARWLRATSIFTLEKGLFGSPRLRVYSANLKDPPLPAGSVRQVLRGDTSEEIPKMVATLRSALENIEQLTASGGSLQSSLANVRTLTDKLAERQGMLGAVLGSEDDARKVVEAIDRANALLASLGGVSRKLDGMLGKADSRVFGEGGVMDGAQQAVGQANAALGEVRDNLKRVERILADAEAVSGNAKNATADLGALRAEVDASLRKVSGLIDEINRKWPFQRDSEIRLP